MHVGSYNSTVRQYKDQRDIILTHSPHVRSLCKLNMKGSVLETNLLAPHSRVQCTKHRQINKFAEYAVKIV